jgi:hypothetical protein
MCTTVMQKINQLRYYTILQYIVSDVVREREK